MLERVLIPLDGSELADRIIGHLRGIFARCDVTLLGVVPSWLLPLEHPAGKNPLTIARKHLGERRDAIIALGGCAHTRLAVGDDAAAKILDFAKEHGSTLIAMSTHGRTGASRLVRGSVAERVLRHSPVPVLLANPHALAKDEELRFKRILVPLDGSERSAEIIPRVVELAKLHGSEVILTYSVPIAVSMEPYIVTAPLMTQADGEAILAKAQAPFYDIPVRRIVTMGDPASNILDLIEREKVDLVAMTTHGRSGAGRWFFGSVAEQVTRHAKCPLLIVRNARTAPPTPAPAEPVTAAAQS
jgi:nucleotide-binding universal stress UspA family protein